MLVNNNVSTQSIPIYLRTPAPASISAAGAGDTARTAGNASQTNIDIVSISDEARYLSENFPVRNYVPFFQGNDEEQAFVGFLEQRGVLEDAARTDYLAEAALFAADEESQPIIAPFAEDEAAQPVIEAPPIAPEVSIAQPADYEGEEVERYAAIWQNEPDDRFTAPILQENDEEQAVEAPPIAPEPGTGQAQDDESEEPQNVFQESLDQMRLLFQQHSVNIMGYMTQLIERLGGNEQNESDEWLSAVLQAMNPNPQPAAAIIDNDGLGLGLGHSLRISPASSFS